MEHLAYILFELDNLPDIEKNVELLRENRININRLFAYNIMSFRDTKEKIKIILKITNKINDSEILSLLFNYLIPRKIFIEKIDYSSILEDNKEAKYYDLFKYVLLGDDSIQKKQNSIFDEFNLDKQILKEKKS